MVGKILRQPNNKKLSLKKIKGAEDAHPYSRKANQMKRAVSRADKLERKKAQKTVERSIIGK